ncbi:MAG: CBS domain-containing protein [Bacteroidetes bacterium]|nr:CBS domain-containing protein [Bacteroidota bacterium]
MFAKDLTDDTIIPAKTSDTASLALTWMDEYKVNHLPIVNNENYLGLITEEDIYTSNIFDEPLGNHKLSLNNPFVTENQHIFEVIKLATTLKLSLIPVLDNKNKYIGVITLRKLIDGLSASTAINNLGGIIVLEINPNDYSLSEIAQIVESNDTKILSLFITSHSNSTQMDVTIKLNRMDISPVLQTFKRYNYNVKTILVEQEIIEDLQDRYDSLMKYLSI